ncbi:MULTISPECIES: SpoIIE family protein phosphatase [Streptomyces]|nr:MULTISPECIES: SpoIIE family protein phosphatase [Streptomyces]MDX3408796.1 SpoIIE family protein phosphatase [Streptomyces sp. ME02-6977A]TYP11680.1 stage II sporulation protein E [Streptomyces coelicolor]TYP16396.1 stage II sporulation protein E [Streptomyces coelicolor A3(2)]TYP36143.1 stage II sporulation protein E [Streptomyces coelicolor]TYP41058.1 stage II sporulation protein E [Streptomyces coelicolor]
MGHDVEAATVMGQLRSALHSLALEGADPAQVLTRLDAYLQSLDITLRLLAQRIKQLTGQIDPLEVWPNGRLQPSSSETLSCSMGVANR